MTVLTLAGQNVAPLTLSRSTGYLVRSFEWRPGEWRRVASPNPDRSGTTTTTRYHADGSITIGLRLRPGANTLTALERRLRAFTYPPAAATLTIDWEDGTPALVASLSEGSVTAQVAAPTHRDVVAQFTVPAGILESAITNTAVANASGVPAALGRSYDLTFDREYPADDPESSVEVVNAGDRDAWPIVRLYGPWSGETSIVNDASGLALVFDGENVTAGNYLEIDTNARTIRLNGNAADSRYDRLVFPDSVWWPLIPGAQRIRFLPTVFAAPAQAQIIWKDAYS